MTGVNQYIPGMPPGSGPLTRALVVALLLGTGLTACAPSGTDQGPTRRAYSSPMVPTPDAASGSGRASSTSASAAPTTLPTWGPLPDGVAPARPAALDQPPTLDGAKAVAAYFLLLYSYAYQTGDLAAWNELSHPECQFCASVGQHVSEATAAGQHTVGGAFRITAAEGTEVNQGVFFDVHVAVDGSRSRVVTATGSTAKDQPAGRYLMYVIVLFEGGAWHVRGVQPEQSQ